MRCGGEEGGVKVVRPALSLVRLGEVGTPAAGEEALRVWTLGESDLGLGGTSGGVSMSWYWSAGGTCCFKQSLGWRRRTKGCGPRARLPGRGEVRSQRT